MNFFSRPLGGILSDYAALKYGMRGRIWHLWIIQSLGGVFCIALGKMNGLSGSIVMLLLFSFCCQVTYLGHELFLLQPRNSCSCADEYLQALLRHCLFYLPLQTWLCSGINPYSESRTSAAVSATQGPYAVPLNRRLPAAQLLVWFPSSPADRSESFPAWWGLAVQPAVPSPPLSSSVLIPSTLHR
jgi:hypothetical protein